MSNGAISNARNAVIKLTGTITGNQVVTVPTGIEKTYIVSNGTTGAFTVEFKQAGGTGVTFATTDKSTKILFADGTNIVDTGTVSETGVQTLTNKTLTSPIINEIDDANGNEQIIFSATASAVNEFTITNAATGNRPNISVTGSDTNIGLSITTKGTGLVLFNDGAYNAEATLTDQATITWDVSTSPVAKVTLTASRTLAAPTNGAAGQFISIAIIQGGSGSYTITWNSAYEFTADTAPTLTTTVGKADLFVFRYNGTVWYEVGRNLNLSTS
jgi:hypothetical protein